jgi:3-isopropylmalate dehydrogenase
MNFNITVLPGDGIGPEVIEQGIKVLGSIEKKYGHKFSYDYKLMGAVAIDATGNPLPDETIESCLSSDAVMLGAIGDPKYDNDPTAKVRPEQGLLKLRKSLGLFANIRPVTLYPELEELSPLKKERLEGVDFVVYRELTGGLYFGEKGRNEARDVAFDNCEYSAEEIIRVSKLAFETAMVREKKLTLVDKANVLETSRLWRETVQELSKSYPEVKVEYMFVDNAAMQIIVNPAQFDVVVTENLFGDIITDEASVLSGSLGLLPSASVGNKVAMFEPIHGSYPQAAGKDIANPIATIMSVAMMLDHLKLYKEAKDIREAVSASFDAKIMSSDLTKDNPSGTKAIGDFVAAQVLETALA